MKKDSSTQIIAVVGPTASGKTQLALDLAKALGGEIICTDSMQVYKGMDIGTAKPSLEEQQQIPHHQLDLVFPNEHYSAGKYVRDTEPLIEEMKERGKVPILVGGSGLYFRSLIDGLSPIPEVSSDIRNEVSDSLKEEGLAFCYEKLKKLDPSGALQLHPNDSCRILRALEVFLETGKPIASFRERHTYNKSRYRTHFVGCTEERASLYGRINERTLSMLDAGWIEEVQVLIERYSESITPLQAIGYQQILHFLSGTLDYTTMVGKIQQKTRNYAKRQLTWFRKESEIHWYSAQELSTLLHDAKAFLELKA